MGDKSILELSALIDKTMPSGEPDKCNAEEAKTVAAYIHETFYSPIAQARNQPPRIELSRLTVRQYRNLLTDLIGSFRWSQISTWGKERLKAEYFNSRNPNKSKREIERVDPQVKFNFADGSPLKDKIAADEFCIQWMGQLSHGNGRIRVRRPHGKRRPTPHQHAMVESRDRRRRTLGRRPRDRGSIYCSAAASIRSVSSSSSRRSRTRRSSIELSGNNRSTGDSKLSRHATYRP